MKFGCRVSRAQLADDSAEAKVRYGLQISRFLKNRPRRERLELWSEVSKVMSRASEIKATRMMNAADVREAAATHEIGVHSYSHESMEFEDDEFFQDDFRKCVAYFRDDLDCHSKFMRFPTVAIVPTR